MENNKSIDTQPFFKIPSWGVLICVGLVVVLNGIDLFQAETMKEFLVNLVIILAWLVIAFVNHRVVQIVIVISCAVAYVLIRWLL